MDVNSFYTVLITTITVLGSASAWRYYEKRAMRKEKSEDYMKDECRERIAKLEVLITLVYVEHKDTLRAPSSNYPGSVVKHHVRLTTVVSDDLV